MKISSLFLVVLMALVVVSCGPDDKEPATPAELQLEKLVNSYTTGSSKTWTVTEVTFNDNENRTADWAGFTLTLTSTGGTAGTHSYSATGGLSGGPWPATGQWEFGGTVDNPNPNQIIRDDNLEIAVDVNESELNLTFIFDNNIHTSGRTEAVNGEYTFSFSN